MLSWKAFKYIYIIYIDLKYDFIDALHSCTNQKSTFTLCTLYFSFDDYSVAIFLAIRSASFAYFDPATIL